MYIYTLAYTHARTRTTRTLRGLLFGCRRRCLQDRGEACPNRARASRATFLVTVASRCAAILFARLISDIWRSVRALT